MAEEAWPDELGDEWPDELNEVSESSEIERLTASLEGSLKRTTEIELQTSVGLDKPMSFKFKELTVECSEDGVAVICVDGLMVWSGSPEEMKDVTTFTDSKTDKIIVVGVNGRIVWASVK